MTTADQERETPAPCPFCGDAAFYHAIEPHEHRMSFGGLPPLPPSNGSHVIECCSCNAGMIADSKAEVFASWDRRTPSQPAAVKDSLTVAQPAPAQVGEVVAWMDPQTLDVIHDARKKAWETEYGLGGKAKAATYTVPMVHAPTVPAGWPTIDSAPRDGTWILIARPEWDQAVVAKWDEYGYVEGNEGEVLMFGWIFRDHGLLMGGIECGFLGWADDADEMPTHWCHWIPTAPTPTQATA